MLSYQYRDPHVKDKGTSTHPRSGRGRSQAENLLKHKSLHVFPHSRSQSWGGVGGKSAPQQMGPTPNFPRPLQNCALPTILVLKKWQIHPCLHRVCVNIPAVAERECQNLPVSAPQPRMCERSFRWSRDHLIFNMAVHGHPHTWKDSLYMDMRQGPGGHSQGDHHKCSQWLQNSQCDSLIISVHQK